MSEIFIVIDERPLRQPGHAVEGFGWEVFKNTFDDVGFASTRLDP